MASSTTYCENAFADRVILDSVQSTTIAVLVVLLIVLAASVNTILAYAMYKCKLLKSRGNFYLFLLTISDGFYSISIMPLFLMLFTKYSKKRKCSLELATCFMGQSIFNISTYLITLIAFHRYLKIDPSMKNLSYKGLKHSAMSGRIANFLVVCCFVIPIAHGFISTPFFGRSLFAVANAVVKGINFTTFLIICGLYIRVYYRFSKKRDKTIEKMNESAQGKKPYKNEFMKTVLLILIALVVTVLPYFITDVWTSYIIYIDKQNASSKLTFSYYLCLTTIAVNCIANALIVIYRNRKVKTFLWCKLVRIFKPRSKEKLRDSQRQFRLEKI